MIRIVQMKPGREEQIVRDLEKIGALEVIAKHGGGYFEFTGRRGLMPEDLPERKARKKAAKKR